VYRERIERQFAVPLEQEEEMQRLEVVGTKKGCGSRAAEPELVG
jgi:hypothetical protein